ncbi:MAG: hypothetical protein PHD39_02860 [Methylobacter tundripaludum]|nr:hypothetical protein [Methylobacter tundripaludum]
MTHPIKENSKQAKKRRLPPPKFVGQVKELGDVMSSVSATDWGQMEFVSQRLANSSKNT